MKQYLYLDNRIGVLQKDMSMAEVDMKYWPYMVIHGHLYVFKG